MKKWVVVTITKGCSQDSRQDTIGIQATPASQQDLAQARA